MSNPETLKPVSETVEWRTEISGRAHVIPITVFRSDSDVPPGTHVYLGHGETNRANRHAVRELSEIGMHPCAVILPLNGLPPSPANKTRIIEEVPHCIVEVFGNNGSPIDFIGKSRGGGVGLMSARKDTPFRAFALISPVGLTAKEFGNTPSQKISRFFERLFIRNPMAKDMWPHRPGNILAASEIVQQFVKDTVSGHLVTTISYALEADLGSDLRLLVENEHPVRIFLPENDAVFPPGEVKKALNTLGLGNITMIVEGSHSPTLNRAGSEQLLEAGRWILSIREDNSVRNGMAQT